MPPALPELPSFARPPVVEVAVGVNFLQLPGLTALPLVDLARTWESRFPIRQEQPALPPVFTASGAAGFQLGPPPMRLWLTTSDGSVLLQIQRDRLLLNWRKLDGAPDYPRYQRLRDEFSECWEHLAAQVAEHQEYGVLQPASAEVTFFNHIPVAGPADLGRILEPFKSGWAPVGRHVATSLQIEEQVVNGDGNVCGQLAIGAVYRTGGLQLELTSRVSLDGFSSDSSILGPLDIAHAAVVNGFDAITTTQAHEVWGKQ